MHFRIEQPVGAPPGQVVSAFTKPERFTAGTEVAGVGTPELLRRRHENGLVELELRYRFVGELSPAARRVLDPDKLSWVQELRVHPADLQAEFTMIPDHYRDRLRCQGTLVFDSARGGTSTLQVMEGELVVSFPLVGPLVERALVNGVRTYLAAEAPGLAELACRR